MSKSCWEATTFVDSYRMRSHCMAPHVKVLLQFLDAVGPSHTFPFVEESALQRLTRMLGCTGSLVSGSAVLSMMTREMYSDQDFDLFVPEQSVSSVQDFVFKEGYEYAGEIWRQDNYGNLEAVSSVTEWVCVRSGIQRKVQVISCVRSPLHTVLGFHSSAFPESMPVDTI